ncbi:alpha/beta hydrolase [Neiella marina]|uniref:Alpha/beta hydrolase n=1 Tax=Neiella holothuriorum TaxID=2870530 RepID=A0ABS7EGY3_9GAMM|nr:alpha/beta hydrolase [Neiella holothuriorum]MBW8191474.1 alpha/beta hydrolase [Neiella holothuriorum]
MAGVRIVLLRGLLREHRHWGYFPNRLQATLPDALIETPDLAGNGQRYRQPSPHSMAAMVDDVRSQIAPLQQGEQVVVVAISMGGMIGSCWAQRYPNELAGLIMINSSLRRFSPFYHRLRPACYLSALAMLCQPRLARESWVLRWTSFNHADDNALAQIWAGFDKEGAPSLVNSLRQLWAAAGYQGPRHAPLDNVLILRGEVDGLVNPACSIAMGQGWQVAVHSHPQAGHDLPLDQPRWVCHQIRDFVAAIGQS